MKFKTIAKMRSNPDFDVDAFLEPLSFNFDASGSFFGQVGEISATVDKIPIRLAIPFLKRRHQMLTIASVGGFNLKIHPMQLQIEKAQVQANGTLGMKGLRGKFNGKIGCKSDVSAHGEITTQATNLKIQFEEEENLQTLRESEDREHQFESE